MPGEDYETVLEKYKKQGKLVGNITTSEVTDATPAAAGSHINARACQGPTDMTNCAPARKANGGKGSIAEQLVDNKIDVLMGGGASRYAQATDAGPTVLSYAQDTHKYRLVEDAAGLNSVTSLAGGPVLGLFAGGNMTPMYKPLVATPAGAGGPHDQVRGRGSRQPARPVRDDEEVDRAARQPQRVLPAGRKRDDRQAGALLRHLRRHR